MYFLTSHTNPVTTAGSMVSTWEAYGSNFLRVVVASWSSIVCIGASLYMLKFCRVISCTNVMRSLGFCHALSAEAFGCHNFLSG